MRQGGNVHRPCAAPVRKGRRASSTALLSITAPLCMWSIGDRGPVYAYRGGQALAQSRVSTLRAATEQPHILPHSHTSMAISSARPMVMPPCTSSSAGTAAWAAACVIMQPPGRQAGSNGSH